MRMFFFAAILIPTLVYAQDVVEPTPADTCAKVARSPGGKLVRIVGARYNREATPAQDTPLGDVVEVGEDDFTPQSLCHVLIKGIPILDEESGRHVPYQPDLIPFYPTVIAKRDVFVFSSWAGRVDLNFAKAKEGKVQPRVPVEGEIKEIP